MRPGPMTHTYVVLELSPAAYDEIAGKLRAAAYDHAFGDDGEIDMHGIAVKREPGGLTIGQRSFERQTKGV